MKLFLMRHGEYLATDMQAAGSLSVKGKNDIAKLATFISKLDTDVDRIWHSSKLRAKQTAEILSDKMTGVSVQYQAGLEPDDDIEMVFAEISLATQDSMIVGHLPFMPKLISQLVSGTENKELVVFQPGTLVCLEKLEMQRWIISWVISPGIL